MAVKLICPGLLVQALLGLLQGREGVLKPWTSDELKKQSEGLLWQVELDSHIQIAEARTTYLATPNIHKLANELPHHAR